MNIYPYEKKYAVQIAALLNDFLPFEPETDNTVDQAGGIRYVSINEHNEVVGYIAGYEIQDFNKEFPYFHEELQSLKEQVTTGISYYTSHFVVHPNERKKGIGTNLVRAYLEAAQPIAKTIVTVGWVQSDTNRWAAERQFTTQGFEPFVYMPRYFEPYNVDCPSCKGLCYCDAHIFVK
ncbi:histone acetyltransferase [Solibacillus silvestris]|nr:GNAT family N-acetyltransferase [Solibacillus silvestris]OBW59443.1 histone acetyltransferase [Solibacillus silvestris]